VQYINHKYLGINFCRTSHVHYAIINNSNNKLQWTL